MSIKKFDEIVFSAVICRIIFISKVVANAVAALSEINEASPSGQPLVEMNAQTINKLLTALNECTEWGQVFILDSLANYSPKDDREAQSICERITPRLAHANAAVVLSAVKVTSLIITSSANYIIHSSFQPVLQMISIHEAVMFKIFSDASLN